MKKLVVLSGAGVSAESGVSTFRDAGGLWEQYSIEDVCTPEGWLRDPRLVTDFYNARRRQMLEVKPNEAHLLLHELEGQYDVRIITQNVDNLHEQAGSTQVIHLHGELMKVTSSASPNDSRYIEERPLDCLDVQMGELAADGSQLRPFIVWFGEAVPMIERAAQLTSEADIYLVIGTSLNVYPAAGLLSYVPAHVPIYLIDPKPVSWNYGRSYTHIMKPATEGMRQLVEMLAEAEKS